MNQEMKKEMTGAYIQACDSLSHDIIGLYLKLESIFDKYYKQGLTKEGEEFYVPLPLNVTLRLKFFKNATELYADNVSASNVKEGLILSKEDSVKKEYSALKYWGQLLSYQNMAIGESYPVEFQNALSKMKPGMIVSFTEGCSYICKKNENRHLVLNRIFDGDIKNINIEKFCEQPDLDLYTANQADLQNFYQRNRKRLSHTTEFSYTFIDNAYVQMKNLEDKTSRFRSIKITLGPVSLLSRKSIGGKIRWYSSTGQQISREQVAYLIGILNTTPTVTTYERQFPTEQKTADDATFRLNIENLLDDKAYEQAYEEMLSYCEKNNADLTIKTDGIIETDGEYHSGSIVFKDGQAFLIEYEDNAFDSVKRTIPLSKKDFAELCTKKYKDSYHRIYTETLDEIQKQYETKNEQFREIQEKVAARIAEDRLNKQTGTVFSKEEITIGAATESDILDSLDSSDPYQQFFMR